MPVSRLVLFPLFHHIHNVLMQFSPKELDILPGRFNIAWELWTPHSRRILLTNSLDVTTVAYDYYRHGYEKRLDRYLTFQWAIRKNHGNLKRPWLVKTLLESINLYPDNRHPERTRHRLGKALQLDGVIESWSYRNGNEQHLPSRHWLNQWMQWKVQIVRPPEQYPPGVPEQHPAVV